MGGGPSQKALLSCVYLFLTANLIGVLKRNEMIVMPFIYTRNFLSLSALLKGTGTSNRFLDATCLLQYNVELFHQIGPGVTNCIDVYAACRCYKCGYHEQFSDSCEIAMRYRAVSLFRIPDFGEWRLGF